MRKQILCIIFSLVLSAGLKSQCLEDFYSRAGGLYMCYTRITSDASAYSFKDQMPWPYYVDYYDYHDLGGISFDIAKYKLKANAYCYDIKFPAIGDAFAYFVGMHDRHNEPYFASFFEGNFGVNLYADSSFVFFAGLKPKLEIISLLDYIDANRQGVDFVNNGGNVFIGPCIRTDLVLTPWLGIRLRASLDYDLFALGTQYEQTHPIMYSVNPEIFTRAGIFFGIDYVNAPTLRSYSPAKINFHAKRIDFMLGWRFENFL